MNKNILIIVLVVIVLVVGGYFVFVKKGSAPAGAPTSTSTPIAGQPGQAAAPITYTDPASFSSGFLQCSPSVLKMPFGGTNSYIITVFGVEGGTCHYASKIVDQNGVAFQGTVDCQVPKPLITSGILDHLFGQDKAPGKEAILAAQTKIETSYCKKIVQ